MSKSEITTIQIERSVLNELKRVKRYPRETYSETILNLIKMVEETKEFGTFVQKAQEERMKKLWEEGDYSGWEHA
jgi:predicted CopG family antitoxin